jgi:hypothetical protein
VTEPTASQAVVETHETALRELLVAPGSFGVSWTDQPEADAALDAHEPTATATITAAAIDRHKHQLLDEVSHMPASLALLAWWRIGRPH